MVPRAASVFSGTLGRVKAAVSVLVSVLGACGPGGKDANKGGSPMRNPKFDVFVDRLTTASSSGDVATLRSYLKTSVINGGIAFDDIECLKQFAAPGEIAEPKLDPFAKCLATLKLARSERRDALPDVVALQYGSGLELEAQIVDTEDGPRLTWLGFVSRNGRDDALPTITARALESLRVEGEPNGPVDDPSILAPDLALDGVATAWLKICIDGTGQVTGSSVRQATSPRAARAFAAIAARWKFQPFLLRGQPSPVCSMVPFVHPADNAKVNAPLPAALPTGEGGLFVVVGRGFGEQIAGKVPIIPSDSVRLAVRRLSNVGRITTGFQFCVDVNGKVFRVDTLRSSGIPEYDRQLIEGIKTLVFRPYLDDGKPLPVCATQVYMFSQTYR
jgi:hypothetical protein